MGNRGDVTKGMGVPLGVNPSGNSNGSFRRKAVFDSRFPSASFENKGTNYDKNSTSSGKHCAYPEPADVAFGRQDLMR